MLFLTISSISGEAATIHKKTIILKLKSSLYIWTISDILKNLYDITFNRDEDE